MILEIDYSIHEGGGRRRVQGDRDLKAPRIPAA